MADTRILADLATKAEACAAKVLLVGYHLERDSGEASRAFGKLAAAVLTSLRWFTIGHPTNSMPYGEVADALATLLAILGEACWARVAVVTLKSRSGATCSISTS